MIHLIGEQEQKKYLVHHWFQYLLAELCTIRMLLTAQTFLCKHNIVVELLFYVVFKNQRENVPTPGLNSDTIMYIIVREKQKSN